MTFTPCKEWLPAPLFFLTLVGSTSIDATGEKFAFIGRVALPPGTTGPKDLRKVHFRFSSVTKAGGSGLTVSLQDVDTVNGPPYRPDGTPDQTVAIANADAGFAANTWCTTGSFSADRPVNTGELLAVVVEYDGAGRLGSDLFQISFPGYGNVNEILGQGPTAFVASAWTTQQGQNNVLLEFSDGTFGLLEHGRAFAGGVSVNANAGSTPDEIALKWVPPFNCKVGGAFIECNNNNANGVFDIVLYAGTTALRTVSIDPNTLRVNGNQFIFVAFEEVQLSAGTAYYLALKPTSAQNIQIQLHEVANAMHWHLIEGGPVMSYGQRTDAGAWIDTATRRPNFGFMITAREYDAGGSSGGSGGAHVIGGTVVR